MFKYLFILLSLTSSAQNSSEDYQLLWEISGKGLEQNSYLFGSLHSNDKRLFNLTDSTYLALNNVNTISLETDMFSLFGDIDTRIGQPKLKFDNDGNPYVSNSSASSSSYGNEDGMPQFLDAYFQQYCYNAGKDFLPLESVDFQLSAFDNLGETDLTKINLSASFMTKDDFVELYLKGDIYDLDEFMRANLALYPNAYKSIIVDRNINMVDVIDSNLNLPDKSIFIAVGAGHLAGENGLINLLRGKGYAIRKIGANYTEKTEAKTKVKSFRNFNFSIDSLGLNMVFPGKAKLIESDDEEYKFKLVYSDLGQGNTYEVEVYKKDESVGLKELSEIYIASPEGTGAKKIILDNGGEAFEGLSETYFDGYFWTRVLMNEDYFIVAKTYGGNKYMNSPRPQRFFQNLWFE